MIGLLLGLALAFGLLLLFQGVTTPRSQPRAGRSLVGEMLEEAGLGAVTPSRLFGISMGSALLVGLVILGLSQSVVIAVFLGALAATGPITLVRYRRHRRQAQLRAVWPDAIEHLASGIRAGLSLPEAVEQIGRTGPELLRRPFLDFARNYRVSGHFGDSLTRLKSDLSDPVGDRVVEALRLARDVGGHDLGRLLRTLAVFLRDDARTRGELESRQSWTVNAARLAVAAPWVLLILLSLRPEAVAAYDSAAGAVVLAVGAVTSVVAYRLMLRLGRLPVEERVLR